MSNTPTLPGIDAFDTQPRAAGADSQSLAAPPRLRKPDRCQLLLEPTSLDQRLPADHLARTVWAVVERLDLSKFYAAVLARGDAPGRPMTDPRLLVALWLLATLENEGSARRLAVWCESHDAYRWICGGVSMNHHTLSDFRTEHEQAIDDLLTQVIAALVQKDVIKLERISQDGLRTRASAGTSSFRREKTLHRLLAEARAHVEQVKQQVEEAPAESARKQAAQKRAATERLARIEAAVALLPELQKAKDESTSGKKSKQKPPRVSTTDAEACVMKLGDGGFAPAYNVQFGVDTASRAIVGVEVVNVGNDREQSAPLRAQVERRSGGKVKEHLFDAGFVKKELIEKAETSGVAIYAPLPKDKNGEPCARGRNDKPGVAAWRERMMREESKKIYVERVSTVETVNAETKTYRGLGRFTVRGLRKVRCVALWSALAYNLMHFAEKLVV